MGALTRVAAPQDDAADDFDRIPYAAWPDRLDRPYDPPICDVELPAEAAREILALSIGVGAVVSSPYRRCLQTAAIVCRELGLGMLRVDNRLGEVLVTRRIF